MKSLLCDLILSCALITPPVTPVEDLYYGTVLYAYYQDDFEQALLESLVAEKMGRRGEYPVRFELAKGSFAFSDGMYSYAEEIFNSVDEKEISPLDRMRLSFHLAREHFRRQDWQKVERDLSQINFGETQRGRRKTNPEVEFMRAELATQQGNYELARQKLALLKPQDPYRAYATYNLGVALKSAGQLNEAAAVFARLSAMDAYSEEALDLIQRSRLALAFLKRQQTETASAETILGSLPAAGRYQDIAMAAYGGLAMDNGDYRLAARIWMSLQNQQYWTPSTAKARLAFPMSLEQLASTELALVNYRNAEKSFEDRLATLARLNQSAADPEWVRGLLQVFSAPDEDTLALTDAIQSWRQELGHTDWLEWLSTEKVHGLLLDWNKLGSMKQWLDQLPGRLEAYQELNTEHRRRAAQARQLITTNKLVQKQLQLTQASLALQQKLKHLVGSKPRRTAIWMMQIADVEQGQTIQKFQRMRNLLSRPEMSDSGMREAKRQRLLARIERAEGRLFWQLVEDAPKRLRNISRELKSYQSGAAELAAQMQRVNAAERNFVAGVETDFLAFQNRADTISLAVDQALEQREETLVAEILAGMQRETRQVKRYLLVTRIAIARATDLLAIDDSTDLASPGGEE